MRLFLFFISAILTLSSCTSTEVTEEVKPERSIERGELSMDSKIFLGNRLFSEKTCITCHSVDRKKIGPSVVDIMEVYTAENGNIVSFLRGHSEPIVDTIPSEVAIMQENIDGFLKKITDEELDAIATYMMHVTKK